MTIKNLFNSYDENSLSYELEKLCPNLSNIYMSNLYKIIEKAKELKNKNENELSLSFKIKIINKQCEYVFSIKKNNKESNIEMKDLTDEEYLLMSIDNPDLIINNREFLLKTFLKKSVIFQFEKPTNIEIPIEIMDFSSVFNDFFSTLQEEEKEDNILGSINIESEELVLFNINNDDTFSTEIFKDILPGKWNFEINESNVVDHFYLYAEGFKTKTNSHNGKSIDKETNFIGIIDKKHYCNDKNFIKNIYENNRNNDLLLLFLKHGFFTTIFSDKINFNLFEYDGKIVSIKININ